MQPNPTLQWVSFANLHTQTHQGNTETYAYDVRQRLTSATRTNGGVVSNGYLLQQFQIRMEVKSG